MIKVADICGRTENGFIGLIQPNGTPMVVRRMTCTENCKVRSRIGDSMLLSADFDTSVLHIAQHEWKSIVSVTFNLL